MVVVLTVDQHDSRSGHDRVPELLAHVEDVVAALPGGRLLRGFQRTVGDEVQAVLEDPATTVAVLGALLRSGGWNIGVGLGEVDEPLPSDTRAGRGPAYVAAREAVTRSKHGPHRVAVTGPAPRPEGSEESDPVGAAAYRPDHLETVLWLWAGLLERRTERGWEVFDALADGLSYVDAGRRLGITQSAVSQRAQAAGLVDERRARELAQDLVAALLGAPPADDSPREGRR